MSSDESDSDRFDLEDLSKFGAEIEGQPYFTEGNLSEDLPSGHSQMRLIDENDQEEGGIRMRDFESQKTWIEAIVPNIVVIKPPEQQRGIVEQQDEEEEDLTDESEQSDDESYSDQDSLLEDQEGLIPKDESIERQDQDPFYHQRYNFEELAEKYASKKRIKKNLPAQMTVYFRLKSSQFFKVERNTIKAKNYRVKNDIIRGQVQPRIMNEFKHLKKKNKWMTWPEVSLEYSGYSQNTYKGFIKTNRYIYGTARTVDPQLYLTLIQEIKKSKEVRLQQMRTFYALSNKIYPSTDTKQLAQDIQDLRQEIDNNSYSGSVEIYIDDLPENYHLSLVTDLIQEAGGALDHIEALQMESDTQAKVTLRVPSALSLANLQNYQISNQGFLEMWIGHQKTPLGSEYDQRVYYLALQRQSKPKQTQLGDILGYELQDDEDEEIENNSFHYTTVKHQISFGLPAMKDVMRFLRFRGDNIKVTKVLTTLSS